MTLANQVAVIADVVDSRGHASRAAVQRSVEERLAEINDLISPVEPFRATVGDEFQAIFAHRNHALAATLLVQINTPDGGPLLRFGLGEGATRPVQSATSESIQDGPGWWAAREAIEELEQLQQRNQWLATWFCSADPMETALVRSYLWGRDRLVADLSVRARSYAAAMLKGHTQARIATDHGVSQPAVSQALADPRIKALTAGLRMLSAPVEEES